MRQLILFLGILKNIYVIRDARGVTIIGESFGGKVDDVTSMEASKTQLEVIHERLGHYVGIDGFGMAKFADLCVLHVVDDEGAATAFGGFMELVIIPQLFIHGIRATLDNGSSVIQDSSGRQRSMWVGQMPCCSTLCTPC